MCLFYREWVKLAVDHFGYSEQIPVRRVQGLGVAELLEEMKNNSRRGYSACITARREVRINRPNSLTQVCALLTVLTTLCGAQSNTLRLVPGSGLIRPLLTPGTLAQPQEPTTPAANPKVNPWDGGLHIEILKGDRGVNIIKKKTAVTPVVEVKDRNNLPVAGIVVLFTSPSDGPSVNFLNGERTFSAVTDANGQASATALQPVNSGSFQIQVSANDKAEVATATISMTNYLTVADSVSAGNNRRSPRPAAAFRI